MLRNLKALHEVKLPPQPNVTIGQAAQVNVALHQINAVPHRGTQDSDKPGRRRRH
jgi:hypothetical protein